jgi:hypothetical protein
VSAGELVQSVSITNLVSQREAVRVRLQAAREALAEVDAIVRVINEGGQRGRSLYAGAGHLVCSRGDHSFRLLGDDGVAEAMRTFDAEAWRYLMHASGLLTFMDAKAREEWERSISDGKHPELTLANVEATFAQLYGARGDMFERGVIECFRRLAWCYKTNLPQKFGKRIVLSALVGWHSYTRCNELDDLLRVMHVLDSKPEPDHRGGVSAMLSRAGLGYASRTGQVENDYLAIRTFKNGNGHVMFKRPDLVDAMNRIIAKHYPGALPAPK